MVHPQKILQKISNKRVIVIGDIMLDHYLSGSVNRMSPEAPVPVVSHEAESYRLGGAANVALNLEGLGFKTVLISTIGDDEPGLKLRKEAEESLTTVDLIKTAQRITTVKTRVVDKTQQLLRIDRETADEIPKSIQEEIIERLRRHLTMTPTAEALILSDYNKGLLTPELTMQLKDIARLYSLPIFIDPKGHDFGKYHGANFLTPNISELEKATGKSCESLDTLSTVAQTLQRQVDIETLVITMGPEGLLLVEDRGVAHFPALTQEVYDVSGAGDTVLAAMVAGSLAALPINLTIEFANLCASKVIQRRGTTPITPELLWLPEIPNRTIFDSGKSDQLAELRALRATWTHQNKRIVFTNGCFDLLHRGHIQLLEFAKAQGEILVVGLNSDCSIKRLKGDERPINNEEDRAAMLNALSAVDVVVLFTQDTPLELIHEIRPDILIKGADYANKLVVGQTEVESWGGETRLCPLLEGYSTTRQVTEISKRDSIETTEHPK